MTETLKAGRELDAIVAEKVMGVPVFQSIGSDQEWFEEHTANHVPHYSTDISDAWEVVEKMREHGWVLDITLGVAAYCRIHGLRNGRNWPLLGESSEETFPLAICLAALQAVGS